MPQKNFCPDCGPAGINHKIEKVSAFFDWLTTPILRPTEKIGRSLGKLFSGVPWEKSALPAFKTLSRLGIGKMLDRPDEQDSLRTKALWEAADHLNIKMVQFRLFNQAGPCHYVASYKEKTITFDSVPRPKGPDSHSLNWMDNKHLLKKHFLKTGIPVAQGNLAFTFKRAKQIFQEINGPTIIKPHLGSRSRHTTIHIDSMDKLKIAFEKAKQLSPWVIVEAELKGLVYRATVIGHKLSGVIRREFPYVIGDGELSIEQLIEKENQNPKRQGPIFHQLLLDDDARQELLRQNMTIDSVPAKGAIVTLNQKVSRSFGASTSDVTDKTHPENIKLFEKIGQVLADPLVGIDFIIDDISLPWTEQAACGVIECNSAPFIDLHHYPLYGQERPVAQHLWKIVFDL